MSNGSFMQEPEGWLTNSGGGAPHYDSCRRGESVITRRFSILENRRVEYLLPVAIVVDGAAVESLFQ
ncbi:MAG: hypothetical protein LIO90_10470 [Bacteroidales bacterium]|nr:hypothetical protein [Bacteroidales bacterium]